MAQDFVKITVLENENEARLLDSILTERDIPHLLRSYHDTAFDGLFQTQKGWGHVSAPPSRHDEIMEIIDDLREAAQSMEESQTRVNRIDGPETPQGRKR